MLALTTPLYKLRVIPDETYRQEPLRLFPCSAEGPRSLVFFSPGLNHPGEVLHLSVGPPTKEQGVTQPCSLHICTFHDVCNPVYGTWQPWVPRRAQEIILMNGKVLFFCFVLNKINYLQFFFKFLLSSVLGAKCLCN